MRKLRFREAEQLAEFPSVLILCYSQHSGQEIRAEPLTPFSLVLSPHVVNEGVEIQGPSGSGIL